jgi:hypothetical protein
MLQIRRTAAQAAAQQGKTCRARNRSNTLSICISVMALWLLLPAVKAVAQDRVAPFGGRWDLTLTATEGSLPSWIDVSSEHRQLKLILVGPTDHATQLKQAEVRNGELTFVSPKGEEGFAIDTAFTLKLVGDSLSGRATNTEKTWMVAGKRAPALTAEAVKGWGKAVTLFDGRDLNGWKLADPGRPNWTVENGTLVKTGHGSELIGIPQFRNFKLHLEFNVGPQSNSGVYLRGRYEVQIETDSISEPPSHHTGGVYGFLDPNPEQPRVADRWQTYDITFIGRNVTIVQNGITVIDHAEIPGITGGALDSNEGTPGPIYLQGSEEGRVAFRNITVTPAL